MKEEKNYSKKEHAQKKNFNINKSQFDKMYIAYFVILYNIKLRQYTTFNLHNV